MIDQSKSQEIAAMKDIKDWAEDLKTVLKRRCPVGHALDAALNHIDDAVDCAVKALSSIPQEVKQGEGLSQIAFDTFPQAIKDWIKELGWKREDIANCHIRCCRPLIFTFTKGQEKRFVRLNVLENGEYAKKVIEEDQYDLADHVAQVNSDLSKHGL